VREYHSAGDRTTTVYGHGTDGEAGRESGNTNALLAEHAISVVA
jgi:hypothetical protein